MFLHRAGGLPIQEGPGYVPAVYVVGDRFWSSHNVVVLYCILS